MWVSQQGVPPLKSMTRCYENTVRLASLAHTLSLSVRTHATPFNNVICSHSSTFVGNINIWKLHFISDRKKKCLSFQLSCLALMYVTDMKTAHPLMAYSMNVAIYRLKYVLLFSFSMSRIMQSTI